ncbi:hypothetical protein KPH14_001336 [Odynerus spinipes]|uniref:DUF4219 domain-containing protein n=1 Tax=Odynerus spinipes TaxID=1348599 RepID=A0AAD9VHX3_9HYME|nr:hypothetical protein KPH14_001336 [Odynerus spinipes]
MTNQPSTSVAQSTTLLMGNIPSVEPKLDGCSNYSSWKFVMKMSLMGMDLWDCIDCENASTLDQKRNQKALACICLNVKTHCHVHLKDVISAKDAWSNLKNAYEDKGLPRILNLMRALLKIEYDQFGNMNQYVSEVLNLSQKLIDIGNPVDDKLLAVIMLAGL